MAEVEYGASNTKVIGLILLNVSQLLWIELIEGENMCLFLANFIKYFVFKHECSRRIIVFKA